MWKNGSGWGTIFFGGGVGEVGEYGKMGVMAFIRKFKTGSGATGVQVCYKEQGRVVKTVHVGSAMTEAKLAKLVKKAQGIIDAEKNPLFDLGKFDR